MADSHADISKHVNLYLGVFAALAVLTIATVAVSRVELSGTGHIVAALVIAAVKASLVATVFMHLKWERSAWIWWPLSLCAFFFVVLLTLPTLTATEARDRAPANTWDKLPVREMPIHGEHAAAEH